MVFWYIGETEKISIKSMSTIAMCLIGFLFILFGSVLVFLFWGSFIQATRVKCVKCGSCDVVPVPNSGYLEGEVDFGDDHLQCMECEHVWSPTGEASHRDETTDHESVRAQSTHA